jgi:hypothetical protein
MTTTNTNMPGSQARSQIDNSILASLIELSQKLGQVQGELTILRANGVDLEPIHREIESLNKILISGDASHESVVNQIRDLKNKVDAVRDRIKEVEEGWEQYKEKNALDTNERKKINLENFWRIILMIAAPLAAGVMAWLGLK